jgi:hypothetical protein
MLTVRLNRELEERMTTRTLMWFRPGAKADTSPKAAVPELPTGQPQVTTMGTRSTVQGGSVLQNDPSQTRGNRLQVEFKDPQVSPAFSIPCVT